MTTNSPSQGHNVGVRTRPRARLGRSALAALTVAVLVLSGCGGSGDGPEQQQDAQASPTPVSPSGNVEVPEGVTLTEAGAELEFGETATVAYEANPRRSSVLELTVRSVREGEIADFSSYQLDARTKRSRPYYVRVSATNIGEGDLSRVPVPLLAVDDRNVLIQPSSFSNTFEKCPSRPMPAGFVTDKTTSGCLVYLVPNGGTLVAMSFRPLQAFEPIIWEGQIQPVEKPAKKKKATGKNKKKKGNR